jgi:predicted glycoside hydrolase/deacetylase ChbG (UPF0249 family)
MLLLKKLIVNADDFGLSAAINAGIVRSHVDGIVTSTSIVASGEAFGEAVQQSRMYPSLGVGVHLTLVEENSVCAPDQIPTLAPTGVLPRTYGKLLKGIAEGSIHTADIERELQAQIDKCLAAGIKITHLDSHQHTHTLPLLFPRVIKLAKQYGVHCIRLPRCWPQLRFVAGERFLAKCVLCVFAHSDALLFSSSDYKTTDHFAGLFESGRLTTAALSDILEDLKMGATELCCHPACDDPSPRYANWNQRRQIELASLTNPLIRKILQDAGVQLISYAQL